MSKEQAYEAQAYEQDELAELDCDWDAPGSGYFEFMNRDADYIEPLNMDEEFARFEAATEQDLIQSAIDLRGIGWSVERIVAAVKKVA